LLCSPALSFGLRAVMLFASCLVDHRSTSTFQQTNRTQAKNHASPCSFRSDFFSHSYAAVTSLIARTALIRSSFALLAHTLPPARGLTSGRPLRSPWAARNPAKTFALQAHNRYVFLTRTANESMKMI
jgi:hypothetical protein